MIKAIVFDMDGLMFDTEKLFEVLFFKVCEEHQFYCTKEAFLSMVGVSAKTVVKLEQQFPGISEIMKEVQDRRKSFFFEYFDAPGKANKKGLQELYEYGKANGYRMAVASSSQREDILSFLDYAGFELKFDAIVSGYDGLPSKPAPDIFLRSAALLGVAKEECLVLEDSKFGTMAAYRAGMPHVFIQDMIIPDEEMKTYIDKECENLLEVIDILKKDRKEAYYG